MPGVGCAHASKRSHDDPVPQLQFAHPHGSEERLLIWFVIHNSALRPPSGAIVGEHDTITGLAGTKMFERVIPFRHRERFGNGSNGMAGTECEHPVDRRRTTAA